MDSYILKDKCRQRAGDLICSVILQKLAAPYACLLACLLSSPSPFSSSPPPPPLFLFFLVSCVVCVCVMFICMYVHGCVCQRSKISFLRRLTSILLWETGSLTGRDLGLINWAGWLASKCKDQGSAFFYLLALGLHAW